MHEITHISVILPLKLEWQPCYKFEYPNDEDDMQIQRGDRVRVTFAHKEYVGVVDQVGIDPMTSTDKVKSITSIERDMERILPEEMELWAKVADYYMCSIGEVYKAAYPLQKTILEESYARSLERKREIQARAEERLFTRLKNAEDKLSNAKKESARQSYAEKIISIKQAIDALKKAAEVTSPSGKGNEAMVKPSLSDAQQKASDQVEQSFRMGKPALLKGVTGSGKTEIYISLAAKALEKGKNVLYLVPEIAISGQLEDRLRTYFGDRLYAFHSGKSAANKRDIASAIRQCAMGGSNEELHNYIILGTRSSIFLPHNNLGLIIVDEEHDNSYKQDSPAPRYHGRDTAIMLAQIHGCDIILGTATPSLESLYNSRSGKFSLISLNERFHGAQTGDIEIIDIKAERRKRGMNGHFSIKLIEKINDTLGNGKQILILCSRRSYSPFLQCSQCGEIVKCTHCNVSLSYHKTKGGMILCHHCGHHEPYSGKCSKCNGNLDCYSAGTQKIEEDAKRLFPHAVTARLDSDVAQESRKRESETIRNFEKGDIDILVGTQMIAKGFDFSNLSLVAVINADSLLGIQDFRADEKAIHLLEQLRGRCGRRSEKGTFIIQTSQPDHPVYQSLFNDRASDFQEHLLLERKEFTYPPFTRVIILTLKDRFEDRLERMSRKLHQRLSDSLKNTDSKIDITVPYPPTVDKIADQHLRCIRINLSKDRYLHHNKSKILKELAEFERSASYSGHITVDVDPT